MRRAGVALTQSALVSPVTRLLHAVNWLGQSGPRRRLGSARCRTEQRWLPCRRLTAVVSLAWWTDLRNSNTQLPARPTPRSRVACNRSDSPRLSCSCCWGRARRCVVMMTTTAAVGTGNDSRSRLKNAARTSQTRVRRQWTRHDYDDEKRAVRGDVIDFLYDLRRRHQYTGLWEV